MARKGLFVMVLTVLVAGGVFADNGWGAFGVGMGAGFGGGTFGSFDATYVDADVDFLLGNYGGLSLLSTRGRTPLENGLHWTTGEKVRLGFYNWIFGIGSFMMGDLLGGFTFAGLGILARSMFVANGAAFEANAMGIVGISAEILIITLSHVRVFAWDRRVSRAAGTFHGSSNPLNGISVTPVATKDGGMGMGFFYSRSF